MTPSRLSTIDLALVAGYLVAITVFGLRFSKRSKGAERSLKSYFLADNAIPWWAIALSIVSAETSTLTIVSIPGVAFAGDFGFLQLVMGYMLGRIVVAALFLPRYFRGEMLTAYQLIDRRFGHTLHKVTAGLFLLTRAAAEGVRVFAISIVVSIAIGTGDTLSIGIISLLTLLYTFEGGLAAVIWTDVVQMGLYVAGTVVALFTLSAHVPGGWQHIHAVAAPLDKFHMLDFALNLTTTYTFWAGAIGGCFLTMASHGTDQLMVQRMLAARNLRDSQVALLASGAVVFVQFTLFLLIGVGLFVFYGAHPQAMAPGISTDRIFPTFIVRELPHGVAGLLVAAILAAAMSNLSAALNSLASTSVVDFYVPLRPQATSRERTVVSRAATVFWALVLFGMAVYSIQAGGKGHVVETGLSIASVAYGSLLGVFLLGTLTKYATQTGAILGMVCGFAVNLILWLPTITSLRRIGSVPIPHVAYTWYVLIGAAVTFAVGSAGSMLFRKQSTAKAVAVALCLGLGLGSMRAQTVSPGLKKRVAHQAMLTSQNRDVEHPEFDFTPISTLVNTAIQEKKLPGAVVLVGHEGKIVFDQAYGNRALEPKVEPMTTDTIFDMASLTKVLVTSVAVLQLYEQRRLDLDDPAAKYLPEFAQNGKGKITIRELLTHDSGLPEDIDMKDSWGLDKPDKAEGIRRAMAAIPYGPPGLTFKYSDINFITLGFLVETLSGQALEAYATEHIFGLLGVTNTNFHPFDKTCGPAKHIGSAIEPGPKPLGLIQYACPRDHWSPYSLDPDTAPTAHDDQGTAATNPDFDHLLRGVVDDPSTRRMGGVAGHAGVFSTADDTAKFAQALLDKLLYDKGPFPLSQKTLQLATSPNEPATAVKTATIFTPDGKTTTGVASRGLGWDLNSAYSRPRGVVFPITTKGHPGSFGHTGFTGTSLWIDPTSDSYVILLSNAIHPRGAPPISMLRGQVATAAAKALEPCHQPNTFCDPTKLPKDAVGMGGVSSEARSLSSTVSQTLTGIDVLEQTNFAALREAAQRHGGHLRIGLLTNQTGVDASGKRTVDILANAAPEIQLTTLFTPEHGLFGKQDTEHLKAEEDEITHLPVISLYGAKDSDRRPKRVDLAKLDAVVVDLQDAGVRFYTYETIVGYFLEAARSAHIEVIVVDRPNPIGGTPVQGPMSDVGRESYTDYMPMPVRHGMTLGELARYFNDNAVEAQYDPKLLDGSAVRIGTEAPESGPAATHPGIHAQLTVVPMRNWTRGEYYDDTHLPWVNPSPNLRNLHEATLYPGIALLETTNVSVGRGTDAPFENIGAPYIRPQQLADYLTARKIPGVKITPATLTVAEDANKYPFHGRTVPGIHFEIVDREALDAPELGVELLAALHKFYPEFLLAKCMTLVANAATLLALEHGEDPRAIAAGWTAALNAFQSRRATNLLYH